MWDDIILCKKSLVYYKLYMPEEIDSYTHILTIILRH